MDHRSKIIQKYRRKHLATGFAFSQVCVPKCMRDDLHDFAANLREKYKDTPEYRKLLNKYKSENLDQ